MSAKQFVQLLDINNNGTIERVELVLALKNFGTFNNDMILQISRLLLPDAVDSSSSFQMKVQAILDGDEMLDVSAIRSSGNWGRRVSNKAGFRVGSVESMRTGLNNQLHIIDAGLDEENASAAAFADAEQIMNRMTAEDDANTDMGRN